MFSDNFIQINKHVKDLGVGILDTRWHCNLGFSDNQTDLHVICADTSYKRLRLTKNDTDYDLEVLHSHKLEEDGNQGSIGVAIDVRKSDGAALITSTRGNCALIDTTSGQLVSKFKAHETEVWTASFGHDSEGGLIATGADDMILRLWDPREGFDRAVMENKKTHEGGITICLHGNGRRPFEFMTGAYDDKIRVWDLRSGVSSPISTHNCGGGVWRLKHMTGRSLDFVRKLHGSSDESDFLLVGACYGGSEIWKMDSPNVLDMVTECRPEGESMAYGVCVVEPEGYRGNFVAASCHFYTKHVCVWPFI